MMLVAETRYTNKNYLKIPDYAICLTNQPSGNSRGGTTILIKEKITYYCKQQ